MSQVSRREFMQATGSLAALPLALRTALAVPPHRRTGTIADLQHVVILMQENRSFDHYFGCLNGVRGFGDPRVLVLPSGRSVFHQPYGPGVSQPVIPFRLNANTSSAECLHSLDHSWRGPYNLWKNFDVWVPTKTALTMGYFERSDIPFYYALADAFTICDAYHCSLFGPTNPNRMFLFTGTSGTTVGDSGSQTINNVDDGNYTADAGRDEPKFRGYTWTTYAERLQAAGVSWKVYQEYDNYGDNSLAYFANFRGLNPSSALYRRGRACAAGSTAKNAALSHGRYLIEEFARDVTADALPHVAWIVAPQSVTEHPDAPPSAGENFTAQLIAALASNPAVWSKSALIINYDENDGFFDHAPPPLPPVTPNLGGSTVTTAGEASPYDDPLGLGPRVPAIVVSPWTRGGYVNSQLFDHTSVIRLLEARFGVFEPNISPWRRAVVGDMTSVFDFDSADESRFSLPGTDRLVERQEANCRKVAPHLPQEPVFPTPEVGARLARPLPYELDVNCTVDSEVTLAFVNRGAAGASFRVAASGPVPPGPWFYTIEAGKTLTAAVPARSSKDAPYDLSVFGPNGLYRRFRGIGRDPVHVTIQYDARRARLLVVMRNNRSNPVQMEVATNSSYGSRAPRSYTLLPGAHAQDERSVAGSDHWYDISVTWRNNPIYLYRFAGHIETGAPSATDPAIGGEETAGRSDSPYSTA